MLKSKTLCWFVRQFGMRTHGNEAPAWLVPEGTEHLLGELHPGAPSLFSLP